MLYNNKDSQADCSGSSLLTGLVVGLITGAAVALLYTPKSGREIRDELKAKKDELPKEFNHLLEDIRVFYESTSKFLGELAKEQSDRVQSALKDADTTIKEKLGGGGQKPQEGEQG